LSRMNLVTKSLLVLVGACLLQSCASTLALNKNYDLTRIKKLAVLDFSGVRKYPTIGQIVANKFNFAMLKHGFNVVERTYIDKIMSEHKLELTGVTQMEGMMKIGKFLGADAIIVGAVDRFKPENTLKVYMSERESAERGASDSYSEIETSGKKYKKASIAVNFRMVDVKTGIIIVAGSDDAEGKTMVKASQKVSLQLIKKLSDAVEKQRKLKEKAAANAAGK